MAPATDNGDAADARRDATPIDWRRAATMRLRASAFTPGARSAPQAFAAMPRDDAAPAPQLPGRADAGGDATAVPRYAIDGTLGAGTTGIVFATLDRRLGRRIAIKLLDRAQPSGAAIESFMHEARLTASLTHPNILPVFDLDVAGDGRPWFSMHLIDGRTLAEDIADAAESARRPVGAVADANAVVAVVLQVCNALAYAHHRGLVHQDVKPANILLGAFGEVLLLDWGSACRADDPAQEVFGTPLYASPEQARRERVDARSDVYCLGGTLLHALLLRPPLLVDDEVEFWRRKRDGEIDRPDADERARVPAPLIAIALKALAADPRRRYAGAEELAADLRAWQAGLAISAYREGLAQRARRWHRRNARALWSMVGALAAVVAAALMVWGERLKEVAIWGAPIVAEDFADDGWSGRWRLLDGGFERRGDALVSTGADASILVLDRRLSGSAAIEFTGEMSVGERHGDLSVVWADDIPQGAGALDMDRWCLLQIGAFENSYATILTPPKLTSVGTSPLRIDAGRRYRIRAEIDGRHLRLLLDGAVICEHRDVFPATSGFIGLYAFFPGKVFRDVRVWSKAPPSRISPNAIGDHLYQSGERTSAAEQYARVAAAHPDEPIAQEALYKEGLCRLLGGDVAAAGAAWSRIADPGWSALAQCNQLDIDVDAGDYAAARERLERLYAHDDHDLRMTLRAQWCRYAQRLTVLRLGDELARWVDLQARLFPDDQTVAQAAGSALVVLGRAEEALRRYGHSRMVATEALMALGRPDDALAGLPPRHHWTEEPMLASGRFEEAWTAFGSVNAAIELGLWPEIVARGLGDPARVTSTHLALAERGELDRALALLEAAARDVRHAYTDRFIDLHVRRDDIDAALEATPPPRWLAATEALLLAGRDDEAVALTADRVGELKLIALAGKLIGARRAGDDAAAAVALAAVRELPIDHSWKRGAWLVRDVLMPFLVSPEAPATPALRAGFADLARAGARRNAGAPAFAARYLLGEIDDDAFLAQPTRAWTRSWLGFLRGVKGEVDGDAGAARRAYGDWLALPAWRRSMHYRGRSACVELFARWRVAALAGDAGARSRPP
ncbi:MAG TPA: protein kinase [Planctomycetota bacterium]|nr:protein kinase [Planctomycetota bacterium]